MAYGAILGQQTDLTPYENSIQLNSNNLTLPNGTNVTSQISSILGIPALQTSSFVIGEYTGNDSSTRTLNIGFRPSLVIIGPRYVNGASYFGLWMKYPNAYAYSGQYYYDGPNSTGQISVSWSSSGITMTAMHTINYYNYRNEKYFYIAFK